MGKLAEKIVLIGGGHTSVRISATNQAKFKRIGTQIGLMS